MRKKLKAGIVGCGAIGTQLAEFIEQELKSYFVLKGVYDIIPEKSS